MNKKMIIKGMNCGKCASRVKEYFQTVTGVDEIMVDLKEKTVEILSEEPVKVSELVKSLEGTKFSIVSEIN
ncbi:heavy-metal-associated domain-containing protein [uncultured Vagococcus sp.]|uniref:heavy-metal-associated domain-containing protein n=1 Tax=uncultured Vagococcus sp. TaxID=189676 RepID=UPI0028D25AEE|nr:heavy-metal-associated domain-containing protein [uncultured Vagococcus sp.]